MIVKKKKIRLTAIRMQTRINRTQQVTYDHGEVPYINSSMM